MTTEYAVYRKTPAGETYCQSFVTLRQAVRYTQSVVQPVPASPAIIVKFPASPNQPGIGLIIKELP